MPFLLLCLGALSQVSCASANFLVRADPTNATELYDQSMDDMESGLYPEALRGFSELKTKYPYTKYAALADLRTADTQFHRGKFAEAVDAYRNFLKFHPKHEQGPYAMKQIGEAYYEQIPSDWFFLPPAAEKDQGHTKQAIAAYTDMLARFPDAEITDEARERLKVCRTKLADHELYVANFYLSRDRYKAAAGRAEVILKSYPELGHDEEALWIAGFSQFNTGELERASSHLKELESRFPQSPWAANAHNLLTKIGSGS